MNSISLQERSFAYLLTTCTLVLGTLYFHRRNKDKYETRNSSSITSNSGKIPPKAQSTVIQTVTAMTGNKYPSFLLQKSNEISSSIFRFELLGSLMGFFKMAVVVGEAKTATQILTDPLSTKPRSLYGVLDGITLGYKSIVTTNGEFWHSRRKGIAPAFSSKHIKRMNEVASEKVEAWISTRLAKFVENDEAFDVAEEMLSITLSAICETAFEYKMTNEEIKEYLHELDIGLEEFALKSTMNPFRQVFSIFFRGRRRAHLAAKRINMLSMKIINGYHELENPTKDTILDRIMNNKTYQNDMERAADVTTLLIAGHDTTAYSIAWILKEIAKHPAIQQSLRTSLASCSTDEFDKLPLLRYIVKEGMRLHPVASGGPVRVLGRNIKTSHGYLLPQGSIIFMPLILVLRDPNVYDNPDSFIPSRWENPTKEMNDSFLPFSAGKQNCVGQSLANVEILNIVPRVLADYELELIDEGITEFFLTLKPRFVMVKARK